MTWNNEMKPSYIFHQWVSTPYDIHIVATWTPSGDARRTGDCLVSPGRKGHGTTVSHCPTQPTWPHSRNSRLMFQCALLIPTGFVRDFRWIRHWRIFSSFAFMWNVIINIVCLGLSRFDSRQSSNLSIHLKHHAQVGCQTHNLSHLMWGGWGIRWRNLDCQPSVWWLTVNCGLLE